MGGLNTSRSVPVIQAANLILMIFPDRGERYLDTVYSDAWVEAQFGISPGGR